MKAFSKVAVALMCYTAFQVNVALADTTIINNNVPAPANNAQPPAPQPMSPPEPQNQLDPRVPPAGVYKSQTENGSSQTLYTTGETKPYNADVNSANSNNAPIQPIVQPYMPTPEPGPRR